MQYARDLGKKETPQTSESRGRVPRPLRFPSPDPFLLCLFQQQLGFAMRPELFLLNNVDADSVVAR